MKTFLKQLILVISFCGPTAAKAQFNTIGATNRPRVKSVAVHTMSSNNTAHLDSVGIESLNDTMTFNQKSKDKELFNYQNVIALPLKSIYVTSPFGARKDPFTRNKISYHSGIDLRAYYEPVYSILTGEVIATGYDRRSGNYVSIKTNSIIISYCHLSDINVRKGDIVYSGVTIGKSGSTGKSTGPHLHITGRINSRHFDVTKLLSLRRKS